MPQYIDDPDAPGKPADVIEVQLRNPLRELAPIFMRGWMKRDLWTRREAILLLAGYDPHGTDWGGHTFVACHEPGLRVKYLDGTTDLLLRQRNAQHPRHEVNIEDILALSEYAAGGAIDERRPPTAWIEWAASKDFAPYWITWIEGLDQTVPRGQSSPAQTDAPLVPGRTTSTEPELEERRLDAVGREIEEAIARIADADTRAIVNPHTVMVELAKRAGAIGCCITGVADGGKAVIWLDDNNEDQKLTKEALRKRLGRRNSCP